MEWILFSCVMHVALAWFDFVLDGVRVVFDFSLASLLVSQALQACLEATSARFNHGTDDGSRLMTA
jgi:hypothetical protein